MGLLRTAVDNATRWIGSVRRHRRVHLSSVAAPVKVNLGCGLAVYGDWVNIDGSLNALIASWPRFFHRLVFLIDP